MDSGSRHFEHVLTIASELGSKTIGASLGPKTYFLLAQKIPLPSFFKIPYTILDYTLLPPPDPGEIPYAFSDFVKIALPIYKTATQLAKKKVIVFTGDHSLSIAFLPGLALPYERCGLIWIDAHADLHTPTTSPSKNLHGMSLGFLLRRKDPEHAKWNQLIENLLPHPVFTTERTVLVGLRSYEHEEMAFISQSELSIFSSEDTRLNDPYPLAQRILKRFGSDPFFVSFDFDSLDATLVPGTGTPVPNGLSLDWTFHFLSYLISHPQCIGVELTEYNPLSDHEQKTTNIARELLMMLFPFE